MNINIFFLIIASGLFMIFFFFKPLDIKERKFDDTPLFELEKFELLELDNTGLTTVLIGTNGIKYSDRYTIVDINYTDNSKEYLANMKAKNALYDESMVNLKGNVVYVREDGLTFKSQKANYNKKTNIVIAPTNYVSYIGTNRATGSYIEYNNILKTTKSKNIQASYQFKERE